jgi:hypothetical protein
MEMSGQFHAPAASPPGKNPATYWIGGSVGPKDGLDVVMKRKVNTLYVQ